MWGVGAEVQSSFIGGEGGFCCSIIGGEGGFCCSIIGGYLN
ncbi:hypothetical protein MC7420_3246 [Coleofasciculus chthonoplastes PCC 7420]|uniref:Uncharacterized protein n=1 Tax=Coleofasciculus chthonoplastes PCC 7420 TaxID=118168 RepID=B4VYX0_9CYAN|nr:hypothetical protein MC7420_3246 [Coleofasciculus chthonoplastes PCC 7420]